MFNYIELMDNCDDLAISNALEAIDNIADEYDSEIDFANEGLMDKAKELASAILEWIKKALENIVKYTKAFFKKFFSKNAQTEKKAEQTVKKTTNAQKKLVLKATETPKEREPKRSTVIIESGEVHDTMYRDEDIQVTKGTPKKPHIMNIPVGPYFTSKQWDIIDDYIVGLLDAQENVIKTTFKYLPKLTSGGSETLTKELCTAYDKIFMELSRFSTVSVATSMSSLDIKSKKYRRGHIAIDMQPIPVDSMPKNITDAGYGDSGKVKVALLVARLNAAVTKSKSFSSRVNTLENNLEQLLKAIDDKTTGPISQEAAKGLHLVNFVVSRVLSSMIARCNGYINAYSSQIRKFTHLLEVVNGIKAYNNANK